MLKTFWDGKLILPTYLPTPHICVHAMYLDEVLGVGGEDRVEDEVVEVGVLRRKVVVMVDEILNVVVRSNVPHVLV